MYQNIYDNVKCILNVCALFSIFLPEMMRHFQFYFYFSYKKKKKEKNIAKK